MFCCPWFRGMKDGGYSPAAGPVHVQRAVYNRHRFSLYWDIPWALLLSAPSFPFHSTVGWIRSPRRHILYPEHQHTLFPLKGRIKGKQTRDPKKTILLAGKIWAPCGCLDLSLSFQLQQFQPQRSSLFKCHLLSPGGQCPLPSKPLTFLSRFQVHDCCLSQLMGTPSLHRCVECANHGLSLPSANWLELHFRVNGSSTSYTTANVLVSCGRVS